MSKVKIMTNLMKLGRDIVAPNITVNGHPTIHEGIGNSTHGIGRQTVHEMIRNLVGRYTKCSFES
jgi:hypothetical protein